MMPPAPFDRTKLKLHPLADRANRVSVRRDMVDPDQPSRSPLPPSVSDAVVETASRMREARRHNRPCILAFGAHTIKNGLAPVLIRLMECGWVQHLATNGAGIIHDWELAWQGATSEDVRKNTKEGRFGLWSETGENLNLAILLGALDDLGYGASVGRLIHEDGHHIPERDRLLALIAEAGASAHAAARAAAAADVLSVCGRFDMAPGRRHVRHEWKSFSVQAAAYRLQVPFTAHPMFGHDIIYTHPLNHGAAVGRTAERDFLTFASQISRIDGGVYLSVGSAVMSPMIFEKSFAMAQNLALQRNRPITRHYIGVVDLASSQWDWRQGEPPSDSPDYYLRFCKTFSRMGGTLRYTTADNRDFLLALTHELTGSQL